MSILVGVASWTDKSLIGSGRFYPKQASSNDVKVSSFMLFGCSECPYDAINPSPPLS
jgi:hypothetical protein